MYLSGVFLWGNKSIKLLSHFFLVCFPLAHQLKVSFRHEGNKLYALDGGIIYSFFICLLGLKKSISFICSLIFVCFCA